jgi:hypothetical protein
MNARFRKAAGIFYAHRKTKALGIPLSEVPSA